MRDPRIDRPPRRRAPSLGFAAALALAPTLEAVAAPASERAVAEDEDEVPTPPEDAAALRAQAIERFEGKDYDAAITLFERAYAAEPRPSFIFNIGRVYEEKGEYERAIEHYTRFLEQPGVPLEARTTASDRIKSLREIVESTKTVAEPEDPPPDGPAETLPPREPREPREPAEPGLDDPPPPEGPAPGRGMRIAGLTLLGVGAAALGTGIGFGVVTTQQHRELEQLSAPTERESLAATGTRNALLADILIVSGGALLATGVVLTAIGYTRAPARRDARAWRVAPALGRRGVGLQLRAAF